MTGWLLLLMCNVAEGAVLLRSAAQIDSAPKYVSDAADRGDSVTGFCVDLYRAIEQVKPSIRFVGDQTWEPASRIEHLLARGRLDVACGLARSAEQERLFTFIEPKLFTFDFHLAVRKADTVRVQGWNDVRDLGEQGAVLVNHGWGYTSLLRAVPGLHIDAGAYTVKDNLHKLLADHGRFYCFRDPGLSSAIAEAGLIRQIRVLPAVVMKVDAYLVTRQSLPTAAQSDLHAALLQLTADGTLPRLMERWELDQAARIE